MTNSVSDAATRSARYRSFAGKCRELAAHTADDVPRRILLSSADTWDGLAGAVNPDVAGSFIEQRTIWRTQAIPSRRVI